MTAWWHYNITMPRTKTPADRQATTLHIDRDVLKALRLKAAVTGVTISTQANRALRRSLAEEDRRLKVFSQRRGQPMRPYEDFLAELKKDGKI